MRPLLPVLPLLLSCASEDYARLYYTQPKAPSLDWDAIEGLDHMGPTLVDGGVNFAVYSERATRVELLLFDDPESSQPIQQFELERYGDVWNLFVEGVGLGQHYGYIAWGPNWVYDPEWLPGSTRGFVTDVDTAGNRFDPNKLLIDPWAHAVHRDHDWSKGSTASGPKRHESTWAAAAKSVVVESTYEWGETEMAWRESRQNPDFQGHAWNEVIVYEVHPKGFTANAASGVDHPGTFRGIGENAEYLADLGITAVELLPVMEKPLDGGYWGYNTLQFFAPELEYSASYGDTGRPDDIIDEFKEMVEALHAVGVEVFVDVVYNHTGEGGLWREKLYYSDVSLDPYADATAVNFDPREIAGLYSFRGLDNHAWYALSPDGLDYWNNTGVGNQTRPNHTPMRRLILDSLEFYAEELHVDGFRFDLAGILGEQDGNYNEWDDAANTVLQEIIDNPILRQYNTRIIAEPWTAGGNYGSLIGAFPTSSDDPAVAWGEWNANFRDWWRSFVNDDDWVLSSTENLDGGGVMTGSYDNYAWNGRKPYHSVNFVTAHDGFTMYDLFSFDEKQNNCGLLNPVCCENPYSVWCDTDSGESNNRSRDWGDEPFKRQQMRNLFVAMMVSHGTPMILGGDEYLRSQYGNNNAYSNGADNEWNWFRWGEWTSSNAYHRIRMHDFVRQLIALRKRHADALAPAEYGGGAPFAWKNVYNADMGSDDWNGRTVMIHYYEDPQLAILINMERDDVQFSLPSGSWGVAVDTQSWYDTPGTTDESGGWFDDNPSVDPYTSQNIHLSDQATVSGSYTVTGSSIVILEGL